MLCVSINLWSEILNFGPRNKQTNKKDDFRGSLHHLLIPSCVMNMDLYTVITTLTYLPLQNSFPIFLISA